MLQLELDLAKSYVWGSTSTARRDLKPLGFQLLSQARELGGMISFQGQVRNAAVVERCRALGPLFLKLRRSCSPLSVKLGALPIKFWARALRAIAGCPLAESHINGLRTQAVKALRLTSAGMNHKLRLGLETPCEIDPEFYQIWSCLRDARRMFLKHPALLDQWRQFMLRYDGRLLRGPFSQLLTMFSRLSWQIQNPPLFADHEALVHDFIEIPRSLLRNLTVRAWSWRLSQSVRHRVSMHDLVGLEFSLARLDFVRLSPLDKARTRALQSGAYMFGAEHSVHDMQRSGVCSLCNVRDTRAHRVCDCPRHAQHRPAGIDLTAAWQAAPECLRSHLLPPANPHLAPHLAPLRQHLHGLPEGTGLFLSDIATCERQHLFSDGSCFQGDFQGLEVAAWGVVNASTGSVVSCAPVHGILQSAPRAELHFSVAVDHFHGGPGHDLVGCPACG